MNTWIISMLIACVIIVSVVLFAFLDVKVTKGYLTLIALGLLVFWAITLIIHEHILGG